MSTGKPYQYCYLTLMRPPDPGTIPRDGLKYVEYAEGTSENSGHHYWGVAVYSRELTEKEVSDYELEQVSDVKFD